MSWLKEFSVEIVAGIILLFVGAILTKALTRRRDKDCNIKQLNVQVNYIKQQINFINSHNDVKIDLNPRNSRIIGENDDDELAE